MGREEGKTEVGDGGDGNNGVGAVGALAGARWRWAAGAGELL